MADIGKPIVNFRALQITNDQRNAYGLRYSDFARYRKHCGNKTHRLRSTLNMTHGKGREFKRQPIISTENLNSTHLELLLLQSERAWAHSQELLAPGNKPGQEAGSKSHLKHNAKGRFRRAVHWSTELLSHCQQLFAAGRLSAENLLEVTVYTLVLNGRWLRHRFDFEDALIQLSVAKGLLDELASTASTSRDQALARLFSDEISPEIRYCAHELGQSKSYDVDGIVAEFAPKYRNEVVEGCDVLLQKMKQDREGTGTGAARLNPLSWEGEPVPIRSPELVDVLLRVQEAEARLEDQSKEDAATRMKKKSVSRKAATSKKGVAAYDAILLALSDAEEVARKLVEAYQLSGTSSTSTTSPRDIQFVHAYIVYQLLARRIQRDLLLMSALLTTQSGTPSQTQAHVTTKSMLKTKVDSRLYPAIVKLLDTVMQSLGQMRTLSIVDDSPDLASAVDARLSFTKAQRCLYVARCYASVKKYAGALTLVQRANIHIRETRSTSSLIDSDPIDSGTDSPIFYALPSIEHDKTEANLVADALKFKNAWFAWNGGSVEEGNAGHKKPLFFDIALNYVSLDMEGLERRAGKASVEKVKQVKKAEPVVTPVAVKKQPASARVEEARPATPEPAQGPARGGLSSLLGGWWGRK